MRIAIPTIIAPRRQTARLLTVDRAVRLTPNMIRVTFAGPELAGLTPGIEGAHCKILLPAEGQDRAAFAKQLRDGPRSVRRTYTIRHLRTEPSEMDIDFVAHGDEGPASAWAHRAEAGSFCGFAGPGSGKIKSFYADWYLVAADMSALPLAAATLEAMPHNAVGAAVIEVLTEEDRQHIDAPPGIDIHWLIQPDPKTRSFAQEALIRSLPWRHGIVQVCIAGESGVIRSFREFVYTQQRVPKQDTYISGYWKIGLVEDEHQEQKRRGTAG